MSGYPVGHRVAADEFHGGDDWTDYSSTFVVTASSTNPTKGTSTYTGEYLYIAKRLIVVQFSVAWGTGFSAGSGEYRFLMPVAASTRATARAVGNGDIVDSGTGLLGGWDLDFVDSTHVRMNRGTTSSNFATVGSSTPITWAVGDVIRGQIMYEPA